MLENFQDFMSKFNVLGLAIGLMIGSNLKKVSEDFIDDIIMPFIEPLLKLISNHGKRKLAVKIPGTSIVLKLKRIVSDSIKFFFLSLIIYCLLSFGIKLKKPIQWVSVRNFKDMKNFYNPDMIQSWNNGASQAMFNTK